MASNLPISGLGLHRVRTRGTPAPPIEWDILQALLGLTYTLQQEALAVRQEKSVAETASQDSHAVLEAALHRIAHSAQNLTEAEGAAIALGTGRRMVCVARTGILAPPLGTELDVRTGLAGDCVRLAKPAISSNTEGDARVAATAAREPGVRSILYLPIRYRGRVLGILGVFATRPSHFSERDLSSLKFTEALVLEILQRAEQPQENVLDLLLKQARLSESSISGAVQTAPTTAGVRADEAGAGSAAEAATIAAPEAQPEHNSAAQPSAGPAQDVPAPLFAGYAQPAPARTRSRWVLIAVIVLVALAVAAAVLGLPRMRKLSGSTAAPAEIAPPPAAPQAVSPQASASDDTMPENVRRATWITPRVRFWSEPGHAVVTVTLDKAGEYQGQRLHSPDRVYFDIDANIVSAQQVLTFPVGDSPVKRVRIAQFRPGISRIVFDLRDPSRYSSELASDPNRLVIDLYAQQPSQARAASLPRTVPPKASATREITVVIDPGHGGNDLGTVGVGGLQEKDLTLDVAERLGRWLEQKLGAKVVYTRTRDEFVPLEQRVALANQAHANFFISIHANGSSYRAVHGVETFYFNSSTDALESASQRNQPMNIHSGEARLFAADVQHALLTGLSDGIRAMPNRGIKPAHFVVLRGAEMPAVLAEISFVTSVDDERRLRLPEYRERVAKALFRGIASHVRRQIARSKVATLAKAATASQP